LHVTSVLDLGCLVEFQCYKMSFILVILHFFSSCFCSFSLNSFHWFSFYSMYFHVRVVSVGRINPLLYLCFDCIFGKKAEGSLTSVFLFISIISTQFKKSANLDPSFTRLKYVGGKTCSRMCKCIWRWRNLFKYISQSSPLIICFIKTCKPDLVWLMPLAFMWRIGMCRSLYSTDPLLFTTVPNPKLTTDLDNAYALSIP
jgi:hypothetical protein